MNRTITITLEKNLKLYSSLKFLEKGITNLKPGITIVLEETGKVHADEEGKACKVFRLRRDTRNYYTLENLL
jgi:hypothetical protein